MIHQFNKSYLPCGVNAFYFLLTHTKIMPDRLPDFSLKSKTATNMKQQTFVTFLFECKVNLF